MHTPSPSTIQQRYTVIAGLPRPRPLRRTPIGNFTVVIATVIIGLIELALLIYLYLGWEANPTVAAVFVKHPFAVFNALVMPFFISLVRAGQRQQKTLVANGEVAIATITGRIAASREWRLAYEFVDNSGQRITNQALDSTTSHSLKEGDQMLVYYDPNNPNKVLAQCTASYEPAVVGMEPDPRFS